MTQPSTPNTLTSWSVFGPVFRLVAFCQRHGLRATLRRFGLFLRRSFSSNRTVLFYYDFPKDAPSSPIHGWPGHLRVGRFRSQQEVDPQDWQRMVNFWNPALYIRDSHERFRAGAILWLIWSEHQLAGYGWTLTGGTIGPHYHPTGCNDVHLFDFLVFPEFRGRNINPSLVDHILHQMAAESKTRAYIEVREWNKPQLCSLKKTRFQLLGVARKVTLFGRTFVEWCDSQNCPGSAKAQVPAETSQRERNIGVTAR